MLSSLVANKDKGDNKLWPGATYKLGSGLRKSLIDYYRIPWLIGVGIPEKVRYLEPA